MSASLLSLVSKPKMGRFAKCGNANNPQHTEYRSTVYADDWIASTNCALNHTLSTHCARSGALAKAHVLGYTRCAINTSSTTPWITTCHYIRKQKKTHACRAAPCRSHTLPRHIAAPLPHTVLCGLVPHSLQQRTFASWRSCSLFHAPLAIADAACFTLQRFRHSKR